MDIILKGDNMEIVIVPPDPKLLELLDVLKRLDACELPPETEEGREPTEDEEMLNALACELFISSGGQCNFYNIVKFEALANCKIGAIERDGFGWLIGGIKYNGKTYSYG